MRSVKVSVPHRLDIGGTWDLPALMYFGKAYDPQTVTIAIDVRTTVTINRIASSSNIIAIWPPDGSSCQWTGTPDEYDYTSRMGLVQAVLAFFDLWGVEVVIEQPLPAKIGLGGSGVLTVALVVACSEFSGKLVDPIRLSHEIENGFFSMTGFQDQMASFFGGVQCWHWLYPPEKTVVEKPLLVPDQYHNLEDRLAVALVGRHDSSVINQKQVDAFMKPHCRPQWIKLNNITDFAAVSIASEDWDGLVSAIREESTIRNRIAPERIQGMERYIHVATNSEGAWATAGAGQAVIWYFSHDIGNVEVVKNEWRELGAEIITSKIAYGMSIEKGEQT